MAQIIPPLTPNVEFEETSFKQFLEDVRRQLNTPKYYSKTSDPVADDIPAGTWAVWKNTTSGLVKVWANDNGVLKSTTLT